MQFIDHKASVSVIVVNYNSGDRLKKCLEHLLAQSVQPVEIIVVDNASSDGSLDLAEAVPIDFISIRMERNSGFAAANNHAVERATGEWIAFLNPDAYARQDWIEAFVKGTTRYPDVDAFGSVQLAAEDKGILDGLGDAYFAGGLPYRGGFQQPCPAKIEDAETFAPCAAAAFYRKQSFQELGGFEESFFCYVEDVDLGFRLRLAGGRTIQLADAVVLHEGSGITGRHSDFSVYHGHRNRIVTHFRNMPTGLLLLTLPLHLTLNIALLLRFLLRGGVVAYLRAMRDGVGMAYAHRHNRRRLQITRKISARDVFHSLTWSPIKLINRSPDLRGPVKRHEDS